MSQLNQAMEVIKDLSQLKGQLLKDKTELSSILYRAVYPDGLLSDNSIDEKTIHKMQLISSLLGSLIDALEAV